MAHRWGHIRATKSQREHRVPLLDDIDRALTLRAFSGFIRHGDLGGPLTRELAPAACALPRSHTACSLAAPGHRSTNAPANRGDRAVPRPRQAHHVLRRRHSGLIVDHRICVRLLPREVRRAVACPRSVSGQSPPPGWALRSEQRQKIHPPRRELSSSHELVCLMPLRTPHFPKT